MTVIEGLLQIHGNGFFGYFSVDYKKKFFICLYLPLHPVPIQIQSKGSGTHRQLENKF